MPRTSFLFTLLFGASLTAPLLTAAPALNPRMAQAASAYLRKQAEQPVAWYPWGDEAFEKARRENKLVLVSLGYSTCHWCHVMARESFSDPEVAEVLNASFVCIKVDREERPDLDRRFISFLEQTQGSAGWPANLWLTPDLTPFFGTGYLPKIDEAGSPGFLTLSRRLAALWQSDPATILTQAKTVSEAPPAAAPSERTPFVGSLEAAWLASVRESYDPVAGGFDPGPKFPNAVLLRSLLQVSSEGPPSPREMALHTLRRLARSSLHDVLGGGFHRYATDPAWQIPHFEKMLVDQAQLALAYTEAWCLTGEDEFKATAASILQGLEAFRLPDGILASAIDADSAGPDGRSIEGGYYLWSWSELGRILSQDTRSILSRHYGLSAEGNFPLEGDHAAHLNLLDPSDEHPWQVAAEGELRPALNALRDARAERPAPFRDETVHAAYNALAVSALSRAGVRFNRAEWIEEAAKLGACLKALHWDSEARRLSRSARGLREGRLAFADDYANTIAAALDLYEATSSTTWLAWALELQRVQDQLFRLDEAGLYANEPKGFHDGSRRVDLDDRAEASPNSTTLLNLQRLAALTGDDRWRTAAQNLFEKARPALEAAPASHPMILSAAQSLDGRGFTVLITGSLQDDNAQRLVKVAARSAAWSTATVRVTPGSWDALTALHPDLADLLPDGALQTNAVVCANRQCFAPTSDPSELARLLRLSPSHLP